MYLPEFNKDCYVLFVGDPNHYKALYNKWNSESYILTVVPKLEFAMRIMEESYFTDCLIDLDSTNEDELRWFNCPKEIKSHGIAYVKKSLYLPKVVKEKFHNLYFFDETFNYDLQVKGYVLVQDKKSIWKRFLNFCIKLFFVILLLLLFMSLLTFILYLIDDINQSKQTFTWIDLYESKNIKIA